MDWQGPWQRPPACRDAGADPAAFECPSDNAVARLLAWRHPGFSAHVGERNGPEDKQRLSSSSAPPQAGFASSRLEPLRGAGGRALAEVAVALALGW